MSSLASEKCVACRRDAPHVTAAEIEELKPQVPDWALAERDGVPGPIGGGDQGSRKLGR
jgi:4a-hydroxytetrahydrobiopterin dehydratase